MKIEPEVIFEFEHKLRGSYIAYKTIYIVLGMRKYLPAPGEKIIVYDDEGRKYTTNQKQEFLTMHSSGSRIDGLTEWYNNHPTAKIGDTYLITIYSDKNIKLSLKK